MGLLGRQQAQFYVGSMVLMLEALHSKNVLYRDLKPENVMLDLGGYLKLIDFGLAKKLNDISTERAFTVAGTLHYMAPEVMMGSGYGATADAWSLGIIFYELVCGRLPFGSHLAEDQVVVTSILQDPLRFPANYHDDSGRTLIHAMLQKAPDQRCLAVSGLHDWAHVKASPFFGGNNLFSKLLTRQLRPPIVPIAEEYMPEDELCDVGLSD